MKTIPIKHNNKHKRVYILKNVSGSAAGWPAVLGFYDLQCAIKNRNCTRILDLKLARQIVFTDDVLTQQVFCLVHKMTANLTNWLLTLTERLSCYLKLMCLWPSASITVLKRTWFHRRLGVLLTASLNISLFVPINMVGLWVLLSSMDTYLFIKT